jgi:histidinol-phosphate phosphatase family domain/HAD-superfamily hydrolase, subfamily IIIA
MKDLVTAEFKESAHVIESIDPEMVVKIADVLTEVIKSGNKVIFMGNGGSSADAQHIAAEFTGKYLFDRPPMSAISLSAIAPMSAIGNDYSFDLVFKRQVLAHARKGDAVIGLSTSGNSKNVIEAFNAAKDVGAITISWTGPHGRMKEIADYALTIPSNSTPRIQEGYFVAGHTICGLVERNMYGRKAVFIDRDDTIAKDVPYCDDPSKFVLFDNVPESIRRLNDAGYLVIMVTNQSGVARNKFSKETLADIHEKMERDIAKKKGKIDDIFVCTHHPDDKCDCRKPDIGMGLAAISKHKINTKQSFMIGNSDADVEFGKRIGCESIKVSEKFTFKDAVDKILKA